MVKVVRRLGDWIKDIFLFNGRYRVGIQVQEFFWVFLLLFVVIIYFQLVWLLYVIVKVKRGGFVFEFEYC